MHSELHYAASQTSNLLLHATAIALAAQGRPEAEQELLRLMVETKKMLGKDSPPAEGVSADAHRQFFLLVDADITECFGVAIRLIQGQSAAR